MADQDTIGAYTLDEQELKNAQDAAELAYDTLLEDRSAKLERIDRYLRGEMDGPYMPNNANAEYRLLAQRSMSNWLIPALNAPSQALYVEGHRLTDGEDSSPAWAVWQANGMGGRQTDLYRDALSFTEAYAGVVKGTDGAPTKINLYGRLNSIAMFEDIVNDRHPAFFLTIQRWPSGKRPGRGVAWDRERVYPVTLDSSRKNHPLVLGTGELHGFSECPIAPFVPYRDLNGRARGIIEPLMPIQDRINQTTFDLLMNQTWGAFQVRYATGMAPRTRKTKERVTKAQALAEGVIEESDQRYVDLPDDTVVLIRVVDQVDSDGNPIIEPVTVSPQSMLVIEDPQAKVGSLDGTPLDGYIAARDNAVRDLGAVAQIPPQFLTGDISNLSADALVAFEKSLTRMVAEIQHSFGESWELIFKLIAEAEGMEGADATDSEILWADTSSRSLAQTADAIVKLVGGAGVPSEGAWDLIPGLTTGQRKTWKKLKEDEFFNQTGPVGDVLSRNSDPVNSRLVDTFNNFSPSDGLS